MLWILGFVPDFKGTQYTFRYTFLLMILRGGNPVVVAVPQQRNTGGEIQLGVKIVIKDD